MKLSDNGNGGTRMLIKGSDTHFIVNRLESIALKLRARVISQKR